MVRAIRALFRDVEAQDLVEYTLLIAFIALVGISIFIGTSGSVQGIWGASNTALAAANSTASGATAAAPASPGGGGTGGGGGGTGSGDGGGGHGDGDHDGR